MRRADVLLVTDNDDADLAARPDAFVAAPSPWVPVSGLGDGRRDAAGREDQDADDDAGWMADGLGVAVQVTSILNQGRSAVQGNRAVHFGRELFRVRQP